MRIAVALIPALFLANVLHAQDTPEPAEPAAKPAVKMDELSKKLVENWKKAEYNLGAAGVKKASYTVKMKMSHPMGQVEGTGKYRWDGKQGSIEWDNPMLAQGGGDTKEFDRPFKAGLWEERLAGATLTAAAGEGETRVKVEGENKDSIREMVFDAQGVLSGMTVRQQTQMGPTDVKLTFTYKKVGEHYLPETIKVTAESPMGAVQQTLTTTYGEVAGFHVPMETKGEMSMGGNPMGSMHFAYSDWKLNEAVDAVPERAPPADDKPDPK